MDKKHQKPITEAAFVRRVILVSLVLALLLLGLLGLGWQNRDLLRAFLSSRQAASGDHSAALKTVLAIENEGLRLEHHYALALQMYEDGAYAQAELQFSSLKDYADSRERKLACGYALADQQHQAGNYDAALAAFASLGSYSDSPQRQQQTLYTMAEAAQKAGSFSDALRLYLSADWEDSLDKAREAAFAITGDRDVAEAMVQSGGQSQEALEKILLITQRRSLFPETRIQAGAYHTVVLYPDGTVAAVGDNTYGQCDVENWKNIIQIAAGAYHTVGLKSDGTVVATGSNDQGQCDVAAFTGIRQIAAGDKDSYGLTGDGQVVMTGYHSFEPITQAARVNGIYAGSYGAVAVTDTGALISSHPSFAGTLQGEVLALGLHTGYLLTHYLDGRLTSSFGLEGDWENITHFDAGVNAIVAVDLNGRVRSHFFRESDAISFSSLEGISQCAAGTAHYLFLAEDGTLTAIGDNTYGQCDVNMLKPLL